MPNKNVNILLKLQDQFTKPMREAGVITKAQEKAMRSVSGSVIGFSRTVRNGFLGGVAHVAKFGAALTGIGGALSVAGIKSFCDTAIEGFNAAEEAETKLAAVLANVPSIIAQGDGAAEAAKTRLVGLADTLEEVGVVAGDVTTAGLQQLATFQLTEESLAALTPGLADLIAQQKGVNASQEDAIGFANLLGKAMTGQVGALSRAGIIMTDYQKQVMQTGTEQERAAMMAQILTDNVGGVNEALAQTDAGKIVQTQNLLGRAQDEIGGKLMHLKGEIYGFAAQYIPDLQKAALGFIDKVTPKIEGAMTWIAGHSEDIKAGALKIRDGVATAWGFIKPVLGFAVQHANTLIPAVLGVVGAISAVSIVADIAQKVHGLYTEFKQMKEAAAGLKGALSLTKIAGFAPVLLIIGAVIAAGILLYKNWDKIKEAAGKLKEKVVTAFQKIRDAVQPIVDLINQVKTGMEAIGFGGGSSWGTNSSGFVSRREYSALGTPFWKGGPTYVNEGRRGEIINLPSGTQIIPHDIARQQAGGGAPVINVSVSVQGNVIGNRQFVDDLANATARRILDAWEVTA